MHDMIRTAGHCAKERTRCRPAVVAPASVVLIAEADPATRRLMAMALRRDGFSVIEAADGAELETWIRRVFERRVEPCAIDLIISDQYMPVATGLDLLARLRRASWSTPFILITSVDDRAIREEADRLGAASVIHKPFDLKDLRAAAFGVASPVG